MRWRRKEIKFKTKHMQAKKPICPIKYEFTHAAGAVRLTSYPRGFIGLWRSAAGRERFPVQCLTDAGETLQEFVARGSEH